MLTYKVVETSTVTDEELERLVNEWVGKGWEFDGFHFVVREASRRPAMAFLTFTRACEGGSGSREEAGRKRSRVP